MQRLQASDIMLIKSEIKISFRPGTLTPSIPAFRLLHMTTWASLILPNPRSCLGNLSSPNSKLLICRAGSFLRCFVPLLWPGAVLSRGEQEELHSHTWGWAEVQPVLQAPLHREDAGAVEVTNVALAARALGSQVIHFYQEIFVIVHLQSAKREPRALVRCMF